MGGNVVEAIRNIRPLIEEHRTWASEHARMAPEVLEATRAAGVYTLLSPRDVGGADATYPEIVDAFEELGYADPTVAWHAGNSVVLAAATASVPDDLRGPIAKDPPGPYGFAAVVAGVATPVDGGYRLNGQWPFLTGALDAPWSWFQGVVMDGEAPRMINGAPDVRGFMLPATDYEVLDTWGAASAMRGTGSHAVAATDVFVPEGLALMLFGGSPPVIRSHASRLPSGAGSPVTNAAIAVGLARRVLDEATRISTEKTQAYTNLPYRELPDRQFAIARGTAALAGLHEAMRGMAQEVESNLGEAPRDVPEPVRARMWGTTFWVLDEARALASDLAALCTSSYYAAENPAEMAVRDVQAICAAMEGLRGGRVGAAGRVYLGMEPGAPFF